MNDHLSPAMVNPINILHLSPEAKSWFTNFLKSPQQQAKNPRPGVAQAFNVSIEHSNQVITTVRSPQKGAINFEKITAYSIARSLWTRKSQVVVHPHGWRSYVTLLYNQSQSNGVLPSIGIVNFANAQVIGGGALLNLSSQEHSLFCETDLGWNLLKYASQAAQKTQHSIQLQDSRLVYPQGSFPKESVLETYPIRLINHKQKRLDEVLSFHIFSSSALIISDWIEEGKGVDEYCRETCQRIYGQLAAAKQSGVETLILGAFGCGAFGNHPFWIAHCYAYMLQLPEFQGCFNQICFAIPGQSSVAYEAFQNVFEKNQLAKASEIPHPWLENENLALEPFPTDLMETQSISSSPNTLSDWFSRVWGKVRSFFLKIWYFFSSPKPASTEIIIPVSTPTTFASTFTQEANTPRAGSTTKSLTLETQPQQADEEKHPKVFNQ